MSYFEIGNVKVYKGSNHYLPAPAFVFDLSVDPSYGDVGTYRQRAIARFPVLADRPIGDFGTLFAEVLMQILKMDMDLFLNGIAVHPLPKGFRIAVEYFDEYVTREAVFVVADYFESVKYQRGYDFEEELKRLQKRFDRTLYGGPTLYSLIEAGLKRGIPVHYNFEENQFQWGYGRKQVRGRSTTFHIDSIKDTEFTSYKDMVKEFLLMCGFPTPVGRNCYSEEESVEAAEKLGYPVVVKPVAGHKGQGVTTGVRSAEEVKKAFRIVHAQPKEQAPHFQGAIVETQVEGTDHRLLTVGGRFVAALQRVPAYIIGDGANTIETLIEKENGTVARIDNARSPLCKIKIDEDLTDYLRLQGLTLQSVPAAGNQVYLRRVANISAGGVSINVTPHIHPKNRKLAEDIACYLNVTCLGIDVLAKDISKPWDEGDFGIIEINAGPGIFMHLAPAIGESIDVPGAIIRTLFPKEGSERIPIVVGNAVTEELARGVFEVVSQKKPGVLFGSLTDRGISFNGEFSFAGTTHDQDVKVILRHPKLDCALLRHDRAAIEACGMYHRGADVVILKDACDVEQVLARDLVPGGSLVEVKDGQIKVLQDGSVKAEHRIQAGVDETQQLISILRPVLEELITRYE